jgi:hypothetical protein
MKTKLVTSFITGLSMIVLAGVASQALAQMGPNPNEVFIRDIQYRGTGCPGGTVGSNISTDAKAFTLLFDSFVAESGPGIPLSAGRKSCQLLVDMRFPQGWSFSLFSVDYRGYMNLERNTTGEISSTYFFQGQMSTPVFKKTNVRGPVSQDFHIRDTVGLDATVWSPCGASRALNINTSIATRAGMGTSAMIGVDSISGELTQVYGIQWRRCR